MATHEHFARFYDALMGDPLANAARVRGYRERHVPAADSLLELGCGSGAYFAYRGCQTGGCGSYWM